MFFVWVFVGRCLIFVTPNVRAAVCRADVGARPRALLKLEDTVCHEAELQAEGATFCLSWLRLRSASVVCVVLVYEDSGVRSEAEVASLEGDGATEESKVPSLLGGLRGGKAL